MPIGGNRRIAQLPRGREGIDQPIKVGRLLRKGQAREPAGCGQQQERSDEAHGSYSMVGDGKTQKASLARGGTPARFRLMEACYCGLVVKKAFPGPFGICWTV